MDYRLIRNCHNIDDTNRQWYQATQYKEIYSIPQFHPPLA